MFSSRTLGQPGQGGRYAADEERKYAEEDGSAMDRGDGRAHDSQGAAADHELLTKPVQVLVGDGVGGACDVGLDQCGERFRRIAHRLDVGLVKLPPDVRLVEDAQLGIEELYVALELRPRRHRWWR